MRKKLKLLVAGVSVLLGILGVAFFIQNFGNTTSQGKIRVACVGDSITAGFEYPNDLGALLGDRYLVGNFGAGGVTVALDAPTPYMKQPAFQEAKEFQPNMVVIMLGTNDAHPEIQQYNGTFVADYLALVDKFSALSTNPKIWIVKPPQIFHNGTGLSTEFFDANVMPKIGQVAAQANLPLIDVYSLSLNHESYFFDGVHPDGDGCKLIAQQVFAAMTQK